MCGRTALSLDKEQLRCACSYKAKGANEYTKPQWFNEYNDGKEYTPSHNIAPTNVTPVLVSTSRYKHVDSGSQCDIALKPMMWGIVPPWHKGDYRTHNLSTNNCRLENIKSSKLYGPILRDGGRCVIVVEGFYEWQTTDKASRIKQPYYIYAPQDEDVKIDDPETWNNNFSVENGWKGVRLLKLAGLYSMWQHNDTIIYSYTVITMESNSTLDWLHHRMPAVLETQGQVEAWLDIDNVNPESAISYLRPIKFLSWHQVSTAVNNAKNKSTDCNKRQAQQKKNAQKPLTQWFTKTEKRKSAEVNNLTCKRLKN